MSFNAQGARPERKGFRQRFCLLPRIRLLRYPNEAFRPRGYAGRHGTCVCDDESCTNSRCYAGTACGRQYQIQSARGTGCALWAGRRLAARPYGESHRDVRCLVASGRSVWWIRAAWVDNVPRGLPQVKSIPPTPPPADPYADPYRVATVEKFRQQVRVSCEIEADRLIIHNVPAFSGLEIGIKLGFHNHNPNQEVALLS